MNFCWLVISTALWAQTTSAEPHIFTAEEFRQHLVWSRGRDEIANLLQKQKLPAEKQRKLLDWAQRVAQKNLDGEPKKDLKIPSEILENPKLKELMQNEKFLEWLADSPRIQEMAERLASKYRLPQLSNPPPGFGPNPGPTPTPGQNPSRQGATPLPPPANLPSPPPTVPKTSPPEGDPQPSPKLNPPSGDEPAEPGPSRNNAPSAPAGRLDPPPAASPPPLDESKEILRDVTRKMRDVRGLRDSKTLDRVEELLGGDTPSPSRFLPQGNPIPQNSIGANTMVDAWMETEWVQDLPQGLSEIPLPPGWNQWLPTIDRFPIPNVPTPEWGMPVPRLPSIGSGLSVGSPMNISSTAGPLAFIITTVLAIFLFRYLVQRGVLPAFWETTSNVWKAREPSEPFRADQRDSIREWFEYVALRRLGQSALARTHTQLARALSNTTPDPDAVERLSLLYEQARYSSPNDPLDERLTDKAPDDLERLKQT